MGHGIFDWYNKKPALVFTMPTPPSVNEAYVNASCGRLKSRRYKMWQSKTSELLMRAKLCKHTLEPPYAVVYSINKKDNRRRDCANYEKCLSDLLVKLSIIQDDSLILCNVQRWMRVKDVGSVTQCEIFSQIGNC